MSHKLLLADDSVTIQRVIELTFADEDIEVVAVGDGQQAIERIASERPDIVLADVDMPGRSGFEVASYVKQNVELAHIPVVLLTGAFEPVDDERVKAAGCDGVLAKPFEPQLLIARVRQLLAASKVPAAGPALERRGGTNKPAAGDARGATSPGVGNQASATSETGTASALDAYFDQLDAAFASLGAGQREPAPAAAEVDEPAGEPNANPTALGEPMAGRSDIPKSGQLDAAPASPPVAPAPNLGATFSAVLAAEQGRPVPPGTLPAAVPFSVPMDAIVEAAVHRVVDSLADKAIREQVANIVSAVAERLVREEIERVKATIR